MLANPLFGVLELEREPLSFHDMFPSQNFLYSSGFIRWIQDVGGFAAIGLLFWVVTVIFRTPQHGAGHSRETLISKWMWTFGGITAVIYSIALALTILLLINRPEQLTETMPDGSVRIIPQPPTTLEIWNHNLLTLGGLFAMLAFFEPFVRDMFKYRLRRIWALAKLSFKEAIRRRVVWAFLAFLLIWVFPANWFRRIKPEYELITHINMIDWWMTILLFIVALMSAFAIPGDIKSLTIHTIVTKPVERFEIVLGRFLGYLGLLTLALFFMCSLTLLLIETSNVDEAALKESMRARNPLYGDLRFSSRKEGEGFEGINVGRERDFRRYLAGGSSHRAEFRFSSIPGNLADDDRVGVEFGFDIYRTTKGIENRGVAVSFEIETWKWDPSKAADFERALQDAFGTTRKNVLPPQAKGEYPPDTEAEKQRKTREWDAVNKIAEQFGRFQITSQEIFDYHTERFDIPPAIFRLAAEGTPPDIGTGARKEKKPRLIIRVRCDSPSQFVGVSKRDLYVMKGEGSFWLNFYKGALGLWCRLAVLTLIAITCSTYLLGVISFLIASFLIMTGSLQDFIRSLAYGANIGGGPFESMARLVRGDMPTSQLEATTGLQVAGFLDEIFRWIVRRLINIIPDTDQYNWFEYVAHGFGIPVVDILASLVFMIAYMLPWAVLAYYLFRSREIAS